MGRVLLSTIIGFFVTAIVVGLLAPFNFKGTNMEKVGELIGVPLGFVGAAIGYVYGLISSRRIKLRKLADKAIEATAISRLIESESCTPPPHPNVSAENMKISHRFFNTVVGIVLFCAAFLHTFKEDVQIDPYSGMLRGRYYAFGILIYVSGPRANGLSRAARRDKAGGDWIPVATKDLRSRGHPDYEALILRVSQICRMTTNLAEHQEFARVVLDDLNERRSIRTTTGHVMRVYRNVSVYRGPSSIEFRPSLLDLWRTTMQEPADPHRVFFGNDQ